MLTWQEKKKEGKVNRELCTKLKGATDLATCHPLKFAVK